MAQTTTADTAGALIQRTERAPRRNVTPTQARRRVVTTSVTEEDLAALQARARREGRTLAWCVANILHEQLAASDDEAQQCERASA